MYSAKVAFASAALSLWALSANAVTVTLTMLWARSDIPPEFVVWSPGPLMKLIIALTQHSSPWLTLINPIRTVY